MSGDTDTDSDIDTDTNTDIDFDWTTPDVFGPQFVPRLRRIQEHHPVFWSGRQNAWLVTRCVDVAEGLMDRRLSNHRMHLVLDPYRKGDVFRDYPEFTRAILKWVFSIDPPEHTRLRKLIVRPFSRAEADRHRGFAADALQTRITANAGRDSVEFITEIAMHYTCNNLLHSLGGFETTANTLTLIVQALDSRPEQVEYIRTHPERLTDIVDELQRFVGMVGLKSRVVGEEFDWHGQHLAKGDLVYLMLSSANRDAEAFPDPDEIRFDRPHTTNMVFGPGLHCIGHHLARMQLEVALSVLYSPHTRIEVLDKALSWTPNPLTRNVTELPVRFLP